MEIPRKRSMKDLKAELLGISLFNRSKTDQDFYPQVKNHRIHGSFVSRFES